MVLSLCSEKKTKAKVAGGVAHSGRATPASGDESSDNYELGPEGEEMDTTEDADAIQDTDATDNQAPRYADLGSPADRCVFPFTIPPSLRDDRALLKPPLCSAHKLNCRPSTNQNDSYPWSSSHSCYFWVIDFRFWDGSRVVLSQAKLHTPLDRLPLPHDVYRRGCADDRRTRRVHECSAPAGQARGIRHGRGHTRRQDAARPWKCRL